MFELLTGKPPFETPSHTETYKKILAADYTVPLEISEEAKDLLSKVLCVPIFSN